MNTFSESDLILNDDGSIYHLALRPEDVAENIIVVGDPGRVERVSKHFDIIEFKQSKREFITHTGLYHKKPVTVMSTGMGVDNIEIVMIELDALFNIDLPTRQVNEQKKHFNIIRIGTSGAIHKELPVGSEVCSKYGIGMDNILSYYMLDQQPFERSVGKALQDALNLPTAPYVVCGSATLMAQIGHLFASGNTVTSPGFYAPQGREMRIPVSNSAFLQQITNFRFGDFQLTNFEMETSMLYAMARMLGHEALSVNAILGNRTQGAFTKNPYDTIDSIIKKVLDHL
jgi:uridine phosphorylase